MLRVEGLVGSPREFGFEELSCLSGQIADVGALVAGREGGAVRFQSILDTVGPAAQANRVTLESADGKFTQDAPLEALRTAVLVYRLGDRPLPADHGGPVRFLIPNLEECATGGVDRCTNVKGLGRIVLS
jgi:DMSO/TMAO reductase YedYZ molybdopterin-dependent catalytic subunit